MPSTRVYRLLRENRMRAGIDGTWEVQSLYVVTGPTLVTNVYGVVDATTALALPVKGSAHLDQPLLFCTNVDPEWKDANPTDGDIYEVRVVFKSSGPLVSTTEPLQWQWDQNIFSEQFDCDINRNPLVNSAGDPLGGSVADDEVLPALKVWRTVPLYDPAYAFTIAGALNSQPMTSFSTWSVEKEQMRFWIHRADRF